MTLLLWRRSVGNPETVVYSVDTLTARLQYADLQRGYRFVHTVNGRLGPTDGLAHYHLDPAAHDDRTVTAHRPLFDVVVGVDCDGSGEL